MRYDALRVPHGPTRKWEIVIDRDEPQPPPAARTAVEVKSEHRLLHGIPDHLLDAVPLLPDGGLLERGERYVDLHDPARGEFVGDGHARVRPGRRVIARRSATREMWSELLVAADHVRKATGR